MTDKVQTHLDFKEKESANSPPNFREWVSSNVWGKRSDDTLTTSPNVSKYRIFKTADGAYALQETVFHVTFLPSEADPNEFRVLGYIDKNDEWVIYRIKTDKITDYLDRVCAEIPTTTNIVITGSQENINAEHMRYTGKSPAPL
jgi:hypothetical protein